MALSKDFFKIINSKHQKNTAAIQTEAKIARRPYKLFNIKIRNSYYLIAYYIN